MLINNKIVIIASIYSHLDKNIYTKDEIAEEVCKCVEAGASIVHFHINKINNGIEELEDVLKLINQNCDTIVDFSISDYEKVVKKCPEYLKNHTIFAAMHADSSEVFGTVFTQSEEEAVDIVRDYLKYQIIPEICIFSKEGLGIAERLTHTFSRKTYCCIYLDYPNCLQVSDEILEWACKRLNKDSFVGMAVYNNKSYDTIRKMVKLGGHIRVGLEDSIYDGDKMAVDNVSIIKQVAQIIKEEGKVLATKEDILSALKLKH